MNLYDYEILSYDLWHTPSKSIITQKQVVQLLIHISGIVT